MVEWVAQPVEVFVALSEGKRVGSVWLSRGALERPRHFWMHTGSGTQQVFPSAEAAKAHFETWLEERMIQEAESRLEGAPWW